MTEQEVLDQIAGEAKEGFSGSVNYEKGERKYEDKPVYRVWNRNPGWDEAKDGPEPTTPGMMMITKVGTGKEAKKDKEVVDKVQAVILYTSHGRKFDSGNGRNYHVVCQSHDGISPSVRIDEPMCRDATVTDLVNIMSGWKGIDQARIDANVQSLTNGTEQLQMCGLATPGSTSPCITLCPMGRRDVKKDKKGNIIKSTAAPCQPNIYVEAYDIKRKRRFTMELKGSAIKHDQKFIAPFHEYFKYMRKGTGSKSFPCYAFIVDLYSASDGKFNYLGVANWRPISDAANRAEMEKLALDSKAGYEKQASKLSREAYEASKERRAKESEANSKEPVVANNIHTNSMAQSTRPNQIQVSAQPETIQPEPEEDTSPVSFDEDDIPF